MEEEVLTGLGLFLLGFFTCFIWQAWDEMQVEKETVSSKVELINEVGIRKEVARIFRQYMHAIMESYIKYKKSGKVEDAKVKDAHLFINKIINLIKTVILTGVK